MKRNLAYQIQFQRSIEPLGRDLEQTTQDTGNYRHRREQAGILIPVSCCFANIFSCCLPLKMMIPYAATTLCIGYFGIHGCHYRLPKEIEEPATRLEEAQKCWLTIMEQSGVYEKENMILSQLKKSRENELKTELETIANSFLVTRLVRFFNPPRLSELKEQENKEPKRASVKVSISYRAV